MTLNGNGSLTINYAATAGYAYHIETATNLIQQCGRPPPGSVTNTAATVVTFTDTNALGAAHRNYRTVSP